MKSNKFGFCEILDTDHDIHNIDSEYVYRSTANDTDAYAIMEDNRMIVLRGSKINMRFIKDAPVILREFVEQHPDLFKDDILLHDIAFYSAEDANAFCSMDTRFICIRWCDYLSKPYNTISEIEEVQRKRMGDTNDMSKHGEDDTWVIGLINRLNSIDGKVTTNDKPEYTDIHETYS